MDPATTSPTASGEAASDVQASDRFELSETDCSRLQTFVHSGHESARARTRAQVLLKLSEGWSLAEVCRAYDVCRNTFVAVRARSRKAGWMPWCVISVRSGIVRP
jgi:hypothetical protein